MKILALEFSSSQRAVAVSDNANPIAQVVTDEQKTGPLLLIDEVLTPDSSRFWPLDEYEPGRGQFSFDKHTLHITM